MKKIIYTTLLLFSIFIFSACNDNSEKTLKEDINNESVNNENIDNNLVNNSDKLTEDEDDTNNTTNAELNNKDETFFDKSQQLEYISEAIKLYVNGDIKFLDYILTSDDYEKYKSDIKEALGDVVGKKVTKNSLQKVYNTYEEYFSNENNIAIWKEMFENIEINFSEEDIGIDNTQNISVGVVSYNAKGRNWLENFDIETYKYMNKNKKVANKLNFEKCYNYLQEIKQNIPIEQISGYLTIVSIDGKCKLFIDKALYPVFDLEMKAMTYKELKDTFKIAKEYKIVEEEEKLPSILNEQLEFTERILNKKDFKYVYDSACDMGIELNEDCLAFIEWYESIDDAMKVEVDKYIDKMSKPEVLKVKYDYQTKDKSDYVVYVKADTFSTFAIENYPYAVLNRRTLTTRYLSGKYTDDERKNILTQCIQQLFTRFYSLKYYFELLE